MIAPTPAAGSRLAPLELAPNQTHELSGDRKWICRCACGALCQVRRCHIRSGLTRSCGCLYKERPHRGGAPKGNQNARKIRASLDAGAPRAQQSRP